MSRGCAVQDRRRDKSSAFLRQTHRRHIGSHTKHGRHSIGSMIFSAFTAVLQKLLANVRAEGIASKKQPKSLNSRAGKNSNLMASSTMESTKSLKLISIHPTDIWRPIKLTMPGDENASHRTANVIPAENERARRVQVLPHRTGSWAEKGRTSVPKCEDID